MQLPEGTAAWQTAVPHRRREGAWAQWVLSRCPGLNICCVAEWSTQDLVTQVASSSLIFFFFFSPPPLYTNKARASIHETFLFEGD